MNSGIILNLSTHAEVLIICMSYNDANVFSMKSHPFYFFFNFTNHYNKKSYDTNLISFSLSFHF